MNERAVLVGKTGSGKSTLARALLVNCTNVIVLDTKREFTLPQARVIDTYRKLPTGANPQPIIYRPCEAEDTLANYAALFRWLWKRGKTTIYIDEVSDVLVQGKQVLSEHKRLIKQGRSLKVRMITCTQRPRWVPLDILSESERYYMFRLLLDEDRKRMAEVMGPQVLQDITTPHAWWYYHVGANQPPSQHVLRIGE